MLARVTFFAGVVAVLVLDFLGRRLLPDEGVAVSFNRYGRVTELGSRIDEIELFEVGGISILVVGLVLYLPYRFATRAMVRLSSTQSDDRALAKHGVFIVRAELLRQCWWLGSLAMWLLAAYGTSSLVVSRSGAEVVPRALWGSFAVALVLGVGAFTVSNALGPLGLSARRGWGDLGADLGTGPPSESGVPLPVVPPGHQPRETNEGTNPS